MKKNIPLTVAIVIPALMILAVALSIYLPSAFVKPTYSFLYTSGPFYSGQLYSVVDGGLVESTSTYPTNYKPTIQQELFVYDATKNQSRQISFTDAQKLSLDPAVQSPDGFQVVSGNYGSDGFPFFFGSNNDYAGWYLKGHNASKKINVQTVGSTYDFTFLGWIKN